MGVRLLSADQTLAQQQLDVAVVAAARDQLAAPYVIDAAVADVRPPAGVLLDEAYGAGGARPLLERQLGAELHDFLVGAPERQVQEAERIEQRLRRVPEGLGDHLLRHLRGARAVRVSAHAVDRNQERCMLGDRRADPILILLAPAYQADIGVFDPQ
jgi:hypothetical protein